MERIGLVQPNAMKAKMDSGGLAVGMIVRLVRGAEITAIARSAGFDSLYIDLEHCSFSLETIGQMCIAAAAIGVTPLVRTAGLDKTEIARTLEAGAQGIIVPHVETRSEAEAMVDAARFAPAGTRSLLGANPHTLFRAGPPQETMRQMNEATLVVAMVESRTAVENVDQIAGVDGLDMLLVGTNDLCASLGRTGDFEHPEVAEAYAQVAEACRRHGKHLGVGGLSSRPDVARRMIDLGARYVSAGSDTGFLMSAGVSAAGQFG